MDCCKTNETEVQRRKLSALISVNSYQVCRSNCASKMILIFDKRVDVTVPVACFSLIGLDLVFKYFTLFITT